MHIFNVYWNSKHIDMVRADSEQQALEKVINCYGSCFYNHSYFRVDKLV